MQGTPMGSVRLQETRSGVGRRRAGSRGDVGDRIAGLTDAAPPPPTEARRIRRATSTSRASSASTINLVQLLPRF